MKLSAMLFTVVLLLTVLASGQSVNTFNNASLNGRYGFHTMATTINNSGKDAPSYPFAISGYYEFDGNGNLVGADTVSTAVPGSPVIVHRSYTGTYTVNSDGTGTLHLNISSTFQPEGDFVIVHGGNAIEIIFAVPGNLNTFSLEKQ